MTCLARCLSMVHVLKWDECIWILGAGWSDGAFEIHAGKWVVRVSLSSR